MSYSYKEVIQRYIILKIQSGEYKIGEKIPSSASLAIRFNSSKITSKNAISELVKAGVLSSIEGVGCFVKNNNIMYTMSSLAFLNTDTNYIHKWGFYKNSKNGTDIHIKEMDNINLDHFFTIKIETFLKNTLVKKSYLLFPLEYYDYFESNANWDHKLTTKVFSYFGKIIVSCKQTIKGDDFISNSKTVPGIMIISEFKTENDKFACKIVTWVDLKYANITID